MDMCMEKGSIEKVPHIFQSALYLEEIPWVLLYMVTNLCNFKADKNVLLYFCFSLAISGTSEQNHTFKKIMDLSYLFYKYGTSLSENHNFQSHGDKRLLYLSKFFKTHEGPRTPSYLRINVNQTAYILIFSWKGLS